MMDIVYILGQGSRWDNNEIRYSIRSVQENFPHRRIFVVGILPPFLTGVVHVPAQDPHSNKLKNAMEKIRAACLISEVSDAFVLMNDDFFILKPTGGAMPYYTEGSLEAYMERHSTHGGYYYQAMGETRRLLKDAKLPEKNFELHVPMIIEKAKFLDMAEAIEWGRVGYLFRSVYGNTFCGGVSGPEMKDVKIYHASYLSAASRRPFLSTSDAAATNARFHKFLEDRFPEPSPYEIRKTRRRRIVL